MEQNLLARPEDRTVEYGGVLKMLGDLTLATYGLGNPDSKIGIEKRNQGEIDLEILSAVIDEMGTGNFNIPVDSKVPYICVDGRFYINQDGKFVRIVAPSAAGATLSGPYSVALADNGLYVAKNELELIDLTTETLVEAGHKVGVHGDNHAELPNCGCGACDKARQIFGLISTDMDKIASLSKEGLGIDFGQTADTIQQNAKRLSSAESNFFGDDRKAVTDAVVNKGGEHEDLVDAHLELVAAINTIPDTTVSRSKFQEYVANQLVERRGVTRDEAVQMALGYEIFVIDAWSFPNMAKELAVEGGPQSSEIEKAMVAQNVATAAFLSDESLIVKVVKN